MIHYQVAPTKDVMTLIADLNNKLSDIAIRLAKLEGNASVPVSVNNDINLNGHKILNQG